MSEKINPQEWTVIGRPGFAGKKRDAREEELNTKYGVGNWQISHQVQDQFYTWHDSLILFYEESYVQYFQSNPDVLDWLCKTAKEVYDTAKSNVASGLDYNIQEGNANHMQDIAIRRALQRLGRKFEGDSLLQVRGRSSKGSCLSPGVIPFFRKEWILLPELESWWQPGSIESFWQSNKVLLVKKSCLSQ